MESLLLHGHYEVALDSKNRIGIPVDVRRRIKPEIHGKDFFLTLGQNRRPWLYPDKLFEELVAGVKTELAPSREAAEFDRLLGLAQFVEVDSQNRITIPTRFLGWLGMQETKEYFLVGARCRLELWKADWNHERESLAEHSQEIVERARQQSVQPVH